MKKRQSRRIWAADNGVGAVEFAFVAGILSLLLLGICDFGLGFWQQMQVHNAARAGAEFAAKNGYNSTNIQTAVTNATNLVGVQASPAPSSSCGCANATTGVTAATCTSTCSDGSTAGTFITVNAQVSYRTLFGWPGISNPMTLASSATVRLN